MAPQTLRVTGRQTATLDVVRCSFDEDADKVRCQRSVEQSRGLGALLSCLRPRRAGLRRQDDKPGAPLDALLIRISFEPFGMKGADFAEKNALTNPLLSHSGPGTGMSTTGGLTLITATASTNLGRGDTTAEASNDQGARSTADAARQLLDLAWEGLPACVTVFTAEGAVAFQNAASRTYMGERVRPCGHKSFGASLLAYSTRRPEEAVGDMDGSCTELLRLLASRGSAAPMGSCSGRGGEAEVRIEVDGCEEGGGGGGGMLSRLFALDPSKLEQLLEATQLLGRRTARGAWEGIVRVPATLHPAGLAPTGADSSLHRSNTSRANARVARTATSLLDPCGSVNGTAQDQQQLGGSPRQARAAPILRPASSPPHVSQPHAKRSPGTGDAAAGGRSAQPFSGSGPGAVAPQGSPQLPQPAGCAPEDQGSEPLPSFACAFALPAAEEATCGTATAELLCTAHSLLGTDAEAACGFTALSPANSASRPGQNSSPRRFTSVSPLATSTWGLLMTGPEPAARDPFRQLAVDIPSSSPPKRSATTALGRTSAAVAAATMHTSLPITLAAVSTVGAPTLEPATACSALGPAPPPQSEASVSGPTAAASSAAILAAVMARGSSASRAAAGEERQPSDGMHTDQLGPLLDALSMASVSRRRSTGPFGGSRSFSIGRPHVPAQPLASPPGAGGHLTFSHPHPYPAACPDDSVRWQEAAPRVQRSRSQIELGSDLLRLGPETVVEEDEEGAAEQHASAQAAGSLLANTTPANMDCAARHSLLSASTAHPPSVRYGTPLSCFSRESTGRQPSNRNSQEIPSLAASTVASVLQASMSSTGGRPRILQFATSIRNTAPAPSSGNTATSSGPRSRGVPSGRCASALTPSLLLGHSGSRPLTAELNKSNTGVTDRVMPSLEIRPPSGFSRAASCVELGAEAMRRGLRTVELLQGQTCAAPARGEQEEQQPLLPPHAQRVAEQEEGEQRERAAEVDVEPGEEVEADVEEEAEANTAGCEQPRLAWHEVRAAAVEDPDSGARYLVVMQRDVTAKVEAERHIAQVSEMEHRLLEQVFPRHVLAYMTEEGCQPAAAPEEESPGADNAAPSTPSWRPQVRDCTRLATWHPQVTILFADIQGFTPMCKQLPAAVVMKFLNDLFVRFDSLLDVHGVYKVETIGDCYVVAGGLIAEDADGMAAVQGGGVSDPRQEDQVFTFAQAMLRAAAAVTLPTTGEPVRIRVGIHSGPVVSGVVGTRMPRFCLFGDTVNTASRMESTSQAGAIHASSDTFALLSPDQRQGWAPTGGIEVKGKGRMDTFLWGDAEASLESPFNDP